MGEEHGICHAKGQHKSPPVLVHHIKVDTWGCSSQVNAGLYKIMQEAFAIKPVCLFAVLLAGVVGQGGYRLGAAASCAAGHGASRVCSGQPEV